MKLKKQKIANEALQAENDAEVFMMEELRQKNEILQIENDKFHQKLADAMKEFDAATNKIKYESERDMREMKDRCTRQM
jgi:regulator of replication initiation timing